ncbi:hypothetical protein AYI68_g7821 [Smittium mucronatum]|uniref:UBA domain-containing protein n=1 Tax=Smittium mucronatum TaxID=133383 RepID=A0A1R0GMM8_9FUNG|nr:hypothetical protein AYI68_g7821 [Smittium mucronatum]
MLTYTNLEGVRLIYRLPFELPKPVNLPADFISETKSVKDIPSYDFDLERRITREELKYKQQEEMQKMVQAQQQLFVMEYLFEKNKKQKDKGSSSSAMKSYSSDGFSRPSSSGSFSNSKPDIYNQPSSSKAPLSNFHTSGSVSQNPQNSTQDHNNAFQLPGTSNPNNIKFTDQNYTSSSIQNQQKIQISNSNSGTYNSLPIINNKDTYSSSPLNNSFVQSIETINIAKPTSDQYNNSFSNIDSSGKNDSFNQFQSPNYKQNYYDQQQNSSNPRLNQHQMTMNTSNQASYPNGPVIQNSKSNIPNNGKAPVEFMEPSTNIPQNYNPENSVQRPNNYSYNTYEKPISNYRNPQSQPISTQTPFLPPKPAEFSSNEKKNPSKSGNNSKLKTGNRAHNDNEPTPIIPPKPFEISQHDYVPDSKILEFYNVNEFFPPDDSHNRIQRMNSITSGVELNGSKFVSDTALIPSVPLPTRIQQGTSRIDDTIDTSSEMFEDVVEQVHDLMAMGFSKKQAISSLERFSYDVEKATNYLLDNS